MLYSSRGQGKTRKCFGMPSMLTKREWWSRLEPIAAASGVELYELEAPSGPSALLKIFIWRRGAGKAGGVGIDDCAKLSKQISAWLETQTDSWADVALEVSSPGINRRLSRPQHFLEALGERVRVKTRAPAVGSQPGRRGKTIIFGSLLAFDGATLEIENEEGGEHVLLPLPDVEEARVDFRFDVSPK